MLNSNSDIIGLQEASWKKAKSGGTSLDWFDTLGDGDTAAGLTAAGYTCVKGDDLFGGTNANKTMYNPIYFKTEKYTLIANDTIWFTDKASRYSASTISGSDTYKALNYVILQDKETGAQFMYVNLHLIVQDNSNTIQELQVIYLREILDELLKQYRLPMFIGGDFNNSASVINNWFTKSVVNADGSIDSNGKPTETVKMLRVNENADYTVKGCSTTTADFTAKGTSTGAIDLWFVSNFEGILHSYIVDDNKNETTGKYPSDHLPVIFEATLYSHNSN